MQIKFLTFSDFHGKHPDAGSTEIRVNQLLRHWPQASKYRYGQKPDALIFQKVYVLPDYHFPETFSGIKILDICDPDWLDGMFVKATVDAMDAVTCPTQEMADFLKQLTDKPVVIIPDRFDMDVIPKPRFHVGKARQVLWFGYRHNSEPLRRAMSLLCKLKLKLKVISNDDPLAWQWAPPDDMEWMRSEGYSFVKYDENTIYADMQTCDFAVLPPNNRPVDRFKSNNRWVKSMLAGLPVAANIEDVERFMDSDMREQYIESHLDEVRGFYDVRHSVTQYSELIARLKQERDGLSHR